MCKQALWLTPAPPARTPNHHIARELPVTPIATGSDPHISTGPEQHCSSGYWIVVVTSKKIHDLTFPTPKDVFNVRNLDTKNSSKGRPVCAVLWGFCQTTFDAETMQKLLWSNFFWVISWNYLIICFPCFGSGPSGNEYSQSCSSWCRTDQDSWSSIHPKCCHSNGTGSLLHLLGDQLVAIDSCLMDVCCFQHLPLLWADQIYGEPK